MTTVRKKGNKVYFLIWLPESHRKPGPTPRPPLPIPYFTPNTLRKSGSLTPFSIWSDKGTGVIEVCRTGVQSPRGRPPKDGRDPDWTPEATPFPRDETPPPLTHFSPPEVVPHLSTRSRRLTGVTYPFCSRDWSLCWMFQVPNLVCSV